MKKKILSIILALTMVLGVIPFAGLTAFAEETHTHKDSTGADVEFTPIADLKALKDLFANGDNGYLTKDIEADGDLTVNANVNLCLNDKVLNLNGHHITVNSEKNFALYDCGDTKRYYDKDSSTSLWTLKESGTSDYFTVGGVITGGKATYGGGVYSSGTFTMYNGNIAGNTASSRGGGVQVNNGTFTMKNGTIAGNIVYSDSIAVNGGGVNVDSNGNFIMEDGSITGNTASSADTAYAGGVYNRGTFTMKNGHIDGNTAYGTGIKGRALGGGLYANGNKGTADGQTGKTIVEGGTISNNKAICATDALGAGVYVAGKKTFTMKNGEISGNTAQSDADLARGGGIFNNGIVYLTADTDETVSITGNKAKTADGGVANLGELHLSGKVIVKDNICEKANYPVNLATSAPIIIDGALTDSEIYVTLADSSDNTHKAGVLTSGFVTYNDEVFTYDGPYEMITNASGELEVVLTHTHTFSKEWTSDSTGHWHECTAEGCDIKDYSTCGLEGAAYSKHTGLTDDNTCDICGTVFYRPYDVSYTDSTITLKVNVLNSSTEPYTKLDCIRFDAFLRANNSGTAYDANMDFDNNHYYDDPHFAIGETPTAAGYCVKNGATYTVVLNAASLDTKITGFDESNPYVWLILRPCHAGNGMDYGYSVNMTYANFYDSTVCLGKFASLEDFKNVKPEPTAQKYEIKANGGATITQKLDTEKSTDYYIATVKIKEDNGINENGDWFVYWTDENGKVVSTYSTYSFYVVKDTTLTPVYVSPNVYEKTRESAVITSNIVRADDNKDGTATLFAEHSASAKAVGNEITQHGIIWTTDEAQSGNLTIGNDSAKKAVAASTKNSLTGLLRVTVDAKGADTVYACSFITDAKGNTTYGDVKTVNITGTSVKEQNVSVNAFETQDIPLEEVIPTAGETETAPTIWTLFINIVNTIIAFVKAIIALF